MYLLSNIKDVRPLPHLASIYGTKMTLRYSVSEIFPTFQQITKNHQIQYRIDELLNLLISIIKKIRQE